MNAFEQIALQQIEEAMQRGEFDNLPGKGKPLNLEEDPFESPEHRIANKILRDAGVAPPEISLRRELANLKQDLSNARTDEERAAIKREIGIISLRINVTIRNIKHHVY